MGISFSPALLTKKAKMICSFAFFLLCNPFWHLLVFLQAGHEISNPFHPHSRYLAGHNLEKVLEVSPSMLRFFSCTSPAFFYASCLMLCHWLKLYSQPLDALELLFMIWLAIVCASCSIGPDTSTSLFLARWYHSCTAELSSYMYLPPIAL